MDTEHPVMKQILDSICPPTPAQTELRIHPALRNLSACYRKAHRDGLQIPIDLRNAIQGVIDLLPKPAPLAEWERDQQGKYDMSPRGGDLRPGS